MKLSVLSLSMLAWSFSLWAGPFIQVNSLNDLESYIDHSKFNGVMLVSKNHKTLFEKAHGFRDFEKNVPLSMNDKFQIGSVSKQFVSASILKLAQEGKLSLEDDLSNFYPEYDALKGIKIRDLLNHTSGIKNYTDEEDFWKSLTPETILSLKDISDFISKLSLDFSPRSNWNYSNSNYILAGGILEKVSGETWDSYISHHFLRPLQMNDSGYEMYFENASPVVGHMYEGDGTRYPVTDFNLSWALSAGALYATAADLVKWTDIYDQSDILSNDSKNEMQTPFLNQYALGVFVSKFNNDTMISHGGRTPGFVTRFNYLKEDHLAVVTFNNTDGNGPDLSKVLLSFFATGKTEVLKDTPYPMPESILAQFVGNFSGEGLSIQVFLKEGKLYLFPEGQKPFLMTPVDVDSFNLEGLAGEEFLRNASGKVIGIRHFQGGGSTVFQKVEGVQIDHLKFNFLLPKVQPKKFLIEDSKEIKDF